MKNLFFITHYSNKFGLGHLKRCINIGDYFPRVKKFYFNIAKNNKKKLINFTVSSKYQIKELNKKNNINIIDLMPKEYFKNLNLFKFLDKNQTFVINNGFKKKIQFDNTIYPYVKNKKIKSKYTGEKFFVINKKILKIQKQKIIKKKKILICMGGSDPDHLTEKVLSIFSKIQKNFKINVIIGPFFAKKRINFIKKYNKNNKNLKFYFNPKKLYKIISESKLAIVNSGNIKYECIFLNTPIILLANKNDEDVCYYFSRKFKTLNKNFIYNRGEFYKILNKLNIASINSNLIKFENKKINLDNFNKTVKLINKKLNAKSQ